MSKNRIDLIGKIFGFLTVESFAFNNGRNHWNCRCICGTLTIATTANLNRGQTKSCGCKSGFLVALKTGINPNELAYRGIYNDYKSRSKRKRLEFELSFEQFVLVVSSNCFYCNTEPSQLKTVFNLLGTATIVYNGIDRKNNNVGYMIENCVPACKICNYAKKAMSFESFINWLCRISKNYQNIENTLACKMSGSALYR